MLVHLDIVVAQSTKHSEVILIRDGVKGVGVIYTEQSVFFLFYGL